MKAICLLETTRLEQSLRVSLRLRWADAEISRADTQDALVEAARGADIVFLDEPSTQPGFELVRRVRASSESGIILLTSNPTDEGMLNGLEAGADDYLSVPLNPALLVARVGALLRRVMKTTGDDHPVVKCGPLDICPGTHEVYVGGHELRLTSTEFSLLHHLAVARGGTMTAKALQKLIWECDEPMYVDTLRKYVQRLRKKLDQVDTPDLGIVAIRGVGYRLAYRS